MNQNYLKLLREFVAIRSVSTDPACSGEMKKTADWLVDTFAKNGFEAKLLTADGINPVVFASFTVSGVSETVLVYGHYDVQPAEISDGWKGDPFVLREEKDRLVARGVIDNKGQVLVHMNTVFELISEKKLRCNVKFLIEGDEETEGNGLTELLEKHKKELASDVVMVSDGEIVGDSPTLEVSLRGGFNATVVYTTAKNNLHSGTYGSAAPNAAHELAKLVFGLYDEKNKCTISGFYDEVDVITPEQRENNAILVKRSVDLFESTGIKKWLTQDGEDFFTQTGLLPSVQVTGFKSGYISEGYANIIPATAEARFNFRLVTSQDPKKVEELFEKYLSEKTPDHVEFKVQFHALHYPVKIDVSAPIFSKVKEHLSQSFGKEILFKHVGGALPILSDFQKLLGATVLVVPLVNEDCNMHGTEENYSLDILEKAMDFSRRFFVGE